MIGQPAEHGVAERDAAALGAMALSVLERLPHGVVVLDAAWVYRYANPAGAALLGTTVGDLLGRSHHELHPQGSATPYEEAYERVMRTGRPEAVEARKPSGDGYVRCLVQPSEGGVAVTFSDVTAERIAAERVNREREVLQQVVDHADALIVLKDLEGRYLVVNRAAAAFLGRAPEEMIGRHACDFLPAALVEQMERGERRVRDEGKADHRELVVELHPGEPRTMLMVRFPAYDRAGRLSGVGAMYTDVTDRRSTEQRLAEALRESAETVALLETLLRSSPVGFAFMDRDFRFERINEAMAALNGLPAEDHIGKLVDEVVPDLAPHIVPIYRQVLETRTPVVDVEFGGETRARPGEKRDWLVNFYPVIPHGTGEPIGIGVLAHEVTAHRRLEAQLRQAQKMEAVGQLAGGIAHDFNNVLGAVTLSAEMGLLKATEAPVRDAFARILRTARSASGLTKQLLVFSRQQPLTAVPVDVATAIAGVREILSRTLGDNIELVVDLEPLPPVLLDPSQLEQIVLNLAINARDAMPHGGRLELRTRLVDVAGEHVDGLALGLPPTGDRLDPGRYVELRVSDTGVGMTAEVRDRAMEPFFTTKTGHGTGLGLATIYGILRSADGAMSISSAPDTGTVVRVLLPAAEADVPVPDTGAPRPAKGTGQRVLVVEDQTELRDVIVEVLSDAGYQVSSQDAATLLDRVDDTVPCDLLVTDVVMPGVSGLQLATAVTDAWPGTRVLFVSGFTGGTLASRGLGGADRRLLAKPFTSAELLDAVADALGDEAPGGGSPTD